MKKHSKPELVDKWFSLSSLNKGVKVSSVFYNLQFRVIAIHLSPPTMYW